MARELQSILTMCFWKVKLASVLSDNQRKQFYSVTGWKEQILEFLPQIRQDYPAALKHVNNSRKRNWQGSPSNGEWSGKRWSLKVLLFATTNFSLENCLQTACTVLKSPGTTHRRGWQSRIRYIVSQPYSAFYESGCLGIKPKIGGKLLLNVNIGTRLIANKYREGKMKSTFKRKLIVHETVEREQHWISNALLRFKQFYLGACIAWIQMDCLCSSSDHICCISQQCASTAVGTEL